MPKSANAPVARRSKAHITHCYLCGRPLLGRITSKDHCPPRFLAAPSIRQQHNLDGLLTLPVHRDCNGAYQHDEQYFKAAMVPMAPGSEAGDAVFDQFIADAKEDKRKQTLAEQILSEFETRPSGLHLPPGRVAKRQDGARITRVAWKIVRGLYFHHHGKILPDDIPVNWTLTPPGEQPPELFLLVSSLPDDETQGRYPGIFDYRFRVFDTKFGKLNYWAILYWDRVIMTVQFHDPWACQCEDCISAIAEMEIRAAESAT